MSNWNTVWHQAMTRSLFQGKAFGSKKTIEFFLRMQEGGKLLADSFDLEKLTGKAL